MNQALTEDESNVNSYSKEEFIHSFIHSFLFYS